MGSSNKKQKTKTAPWKAQQPYIKDAFAGAQDTYKAGMTPNANLTSGWSALANTANDPNSGLNQSKGYWGNILANGGYDDNVFKNIASHIVPTVNSQFMGSGRTGGGLQGIDLTQELTQAYSPFAVEQANKASAALPMLDSQGANNLLQAGQGQYQYPWQNLNNYYGIIGANNWGGTTTSTQPGGASPWAQILGAGVGLAGSALSGGIIPPNVGMGLGSSAGGYLGGQFSPSQF